MDFKLIWDGNVLLAETPVWDPGLDRLIWTDLYAGEVHETDLEQKTDKVWKAGAAIGSAIPTDDPAMLLVAVDDGIFLLNKEDGSREPVADPEPGRPDFTLSDSRIDAAGRILTSTVSRLYGTSDYRDDMVGSFYMVDTDRSVHVIETGVNQYNCMTWNSACTQMFVVDSHYQNLLVFDYSIGGGPAGGSRIALSLQEYGVPDGISIDIEDNLYICHWAGRITVWDKHLNLKEVYDFPVPQVCCGGFGGPDRKDFFVSTARYAYSPEQLENRYGAGGIFVGRNEIAGAELNFWKV